VNLRGNLKPGQMEKTLETNNFALLISGKENDPNEMHRGKNFSPSWTEAKTRDKENTDFNWN